MFVGTYWGRVWRRRYIKAVLPRHLEHPYDLVLSLGVAPMFTLPDVPTVAWLQGPQHTELEAIKRLRRMISEVSGRAFYRQLVLFYQIRRWRERHRLDACTRVICGSTWAMDAFVASGLPADRLRAIPYPIDLLRFRPSDTAGPADHPRLLALGRLDPRKRLDLLIAGFELVADELPGVTLRIVGGPGYAPNQTLLIERSRWRHRIDYSDVVPRSEIPRLLADADALVQTSENENFGSSVAEALACGVPVVVGPSNGTRDYIDANSQVFSAYAPPAVASAIRTVLDRLTTNRKGTSVGARDAAERWFRLPVVVDSLEEVLQGLVRAPTDGLSHPYGTARSPRMASEE